MRILHVASEVIPFAKTGGLADVVGTLPRVMARMGHEVAVVLPKYRTVSEDKYHLQEVLPELPVPFHAGHLMATIAMAPLDLSSPSGATAYFIRKDEFFDREGLYGHPDDPERFIFFDRAVLEMLKALNWRPDVIHCHDWHTGFIPVYLKTLYAGDTFFADTVSVFTVHNLAYQGNCPREKLSVAQLPESVFNYHELEFYGMLSPMKGGLVFADALTTVSEQYAREIQTPEYGERLEGVLAERKEALFGITNGVDYEEWNPATDPFIPSNYDMNILTKKNINRRALQKRGGLPQLTRKRVPVIGCVSRLSFQKGFDLVAEIVDQMMELNVQLVLLGDGDDSYIRLFRDIAARYPHQTCFTLGKFDNELAHQIYAGSDMFLMPSRYEPCGIGQLISLAYGTIPVVRATGGLHDTIQEYDPITKTGNGFRFDEFTPQALLQCLTRAVKTYRQPALWKPLMQNAMRYDFSWEASARKYLALYESVLRKSV